MPWRLDPGNDLILNIHLKPSGKPETLDAEVGLYFTPDPPTKQPMLIALERDDQLDIPAGDSSFAIERTRSPCPGGRGCAGLLSPRALSGP